MSWFQSFQCPKKEFLLRVSYMEIYNETVTDLLVDSWKRKPLEIREGNYVSVTFFDLICLNFECAVSNSTRLFHWQKNVYVADLTEELVTSPEQALAWIRKGESNVIIC